MSKGTPSPCIKVCTVDPFSGFCNGCFRTLLEIEQWPKMEEEEKVDLVKRLNNRKPKNLSGSY